MARRWWRNHDNHRSSHQCFLVLLRRHFFFGFQVKQGKTPINIKLRWWWQKIKKNKKKKKEDDEDEEERRTKYLEELIRQDTKDTNCICQVTMKAKDDDDADEMRTRGREERERRSNADCDSGMHINELMRNIKTNPSELIFINQSIEAYGQRPHRAVKVISNVVSMVVSAHVRQFLRCNNVLIQNTEEMRSTHIYRKQHNIYSTNVNRFTNWNSRTNGINLSHNNSNNFGQSRVRVTCVYVLHMTAFCTWMRRLKMPKKNIEIGPAAKQFSHRKITMYERASTNTHQVDCIVVVSTLYTHHTHHTPALRLSFCIESTTGETYNRRIKWMKSKLTATSCANVCVEWHSVKWSGDHNTHKQLIISRTVNWTHISILLTVCRWFVSIYFFTRFLSFSRGLLRFCFSFFKFFLDFIFPKKL